MALLETCAREKLLIVVFLIQSYRCIYNISLGLEGLDEGLRGWVLELSLRLKMILALELDLWLEVVLSRNLNRRLLWCVVLEFLFIVLSWDIYILDWALWLIGSVTIEHITVSILVNNITSILNWPLTKIGRNIGADFGRYLPNFLIGSRWNHIFRINFISYYVYLLWEVNFRCNTLSMLIF